MTFEPRQKNKVPEVTIIALFVAAGVAFAFSAIDGLSGQGMLQFAAMALFCAMIFVAVRYKFTSFKYTVRVAAAPKKSLHHEDEEDEEEEEIPLTPDGKEPPVTMYPPKKLVFVVERRQGNSKWNMECLVRLTDIHACFTLPEDKEALDAALKENRRAPKYKYFKNMATPDQTVLIADTMVGKAIVYFETDGKMSQYLKSVAAFNRDNK